MGSSNGGQADRVSALIGMDISEYLDADARAHRIEPDVDASRGWKALMLAPNIDICRALLRGERVPWRTLRPEQAERFGLKRVHDDGRVALDDFNDVRK